MDEFLTWEDVEPTLSLEKSREIVGAYLADLARVHRLKDNQIVRELFRDEAIQELGINHLAPLIRELRENSSK
jgi:hypothetical protein